MSYDLNQQQTILLESLIKAMEDNPRYRSMRGTYFSAPVINQDVQYFGAACLLGTGLLYAGMSSEDYWKSEHSAAHHFAQTFDVSMDYARGAEAGFEAWTEADFGGSYEEYGINIKEFHKGYVVGQAFYDAMAERGLVVDRWLIAHGVK
jgi:hypothetical protein